MVRHFKGQQYDQLRKSHQTSGTLFTDPAFPADRSSLYLPGNTSGRAVEWKRPKDLVEQPQLVVNGVDGNDLNQGDVGNCWFVAACATLAGVSGLWDKVVVNLQDQEWDDAHPEKYAGIFRFHFWRMGEWVEVVIDDRLPTVNGRLIYVHSKDENEFWSPLLEKAYAKLAGSYEGLDSGNAGDALVDFSGGVCQTLKLKEYDSEDKKKELFRIMAKAVDRQAMLTCSIQASAEEREARLDTGLIKGHSYGITAVKKVKIGEGLFSTKKFRLVRIRNPWGEREWKGAWSDGSDEWSAVSEAERKRLGIVFSDDGEFWMSFEDWLTHFTIARVARLLNTSYLSLRKTWHESVFLGDWSGPTAGGCINYPTTFFKNPQFMFNVKKGEDGSTMIDLMQEDGRAEGKDNHSIGYQIFKVEENRQHRLKAQMAPTFSVHYINSRSNYGEFLLGEGRYVVLPSTFEPKNKGRFLLRIYTEHAAKAMKLVEEHLTVPWWQCCASPYAAVVRMHFHNATGLSKQDMIGTADPYVYAKCAGKTARSPVVKDSLEPVFNSQMIFFVKRPRRQSVDVEIWNSGLIRDRFMGQVRIELHPDGESRQTTLRLHRKNQPENFTSGHITVTVVCSDDLNSM